MGPGRLILPLHFFLKADISNHMQIKQYILSLLITGVVIDGVDLTLSNPSSVILNEADPNPLNVTSSVTLTVANVSAAIDGKYKTCSLCPHSLCFFFFFLTVSTGHRLVYSPTDVGAVQ